MEYLYINISFQLYSQWDSLQWLKLDLSLLSQFDACDLEAAVNALCRYIQECDWD